MSVDVMYQPYVPYLPYQRHNQNAMDQIKKYCPQRIPDPLDVASYSSSSLGSASSVSANVCSPSGIGSNTPVGSGMSSGSQTSGHTSSHGALHSTTTPNPEHSTTSLVLKEELMDHHNPHHQSNLSHHSHHLNSQALHNSLTNSTGGNTSKDNDTSPVSTHYISANCVVLTYFSGDAATNVEEHFSRALSQPSNFSPENQGTKPTPSWRDLAPMSQRNFPASFWNSSYYSNSSSLGAASGHTDFSLSDPYMTASSLHSMTSLQDHWRYPLASQALATQNPYGHHSAAAMHDLAYSTMAAATGSGRFGSHYGSLLPSRLGAQCDLVKHPGAADAWPSRYADSRYADSLTQSHHDSHLHSSIAGGIDSTTSLPEPSKDLYWF